MQRPVVSYEEHATFCIHQNEENSACGTSASVKTSSFRFAGLPQASKPPLFDLRNFRKRQNVLFLICGTSASTKTSSFRFAELPQAPKRPLFDLRNFRKRFSVCRKPFDQSSY